MPCTSLTAQFNCSEFNPCTKSPGLFQCTGGRGVLDFCRFVGLTPKQQWEPQCPVGHGLGGGLSTLIPESFLNSVDMFHSKLPRDWCSGGILTFVSPFCLTVGVCNTDNFSVLSITIDYGPFGFMDSYDPSECSTCFYFILFLLKTIFLY